MSKTQAPTKPFVTISPHQKKSFKPERIQINYSSKIGYLLEVVINDECSVGTYIPTKYVPSMKKIIKEREEQLIKIFDTYNNERGFLWFLLDIGLLCKFFEKFKNRPNCNELIDINQAADLFHNRYVAQTLWIYELNGLKGKVLKKNEFNATPDLKINDTNVEIKTIQPIRKINIMKKGVYLNPEDRKTFLSALRNRTLEAMQQATDSGCVLVFFWCNVTNIFLVQLLKGYHDPKFPTLLPGRIYFMYRNASDWNKHFFTQISYNTFDENIDKLDSILQQSLLTGIKRTGELQHFDLWFNPAGIPFWQNCTHNPGLNMIVCKFEVNLK